MPFIFSLVKNTASVLIGRFSRGQAPLMMWGWDEPRSEGGYMNLVIITLMMRNFNTDHSVMTCMTPSLEHQTQICEKLNI